MRFESKPLNLMTVNFSHYMFKTNQYISWDDKHSMWSNNGMSFVQNFVITIMIMYKPELSINRQNTYIDWLNVVSGLMIN